MEHAGKHYVELASGESVPIIGALSIGRAHSNQLVLADEKVSRHHALIQTNENQECWIIDLASANGTYVNQRRIDHAMLLRERDEITIGPERIVFRSSDEAAARRDDPLSLDQTVHEVRQLAAWLLLVDIVDSTGIGRRLGPYAMASKFSAWLARFRETLGQSGGIIDQPLGDGFFAFWPAADQSAEQMVGALRACKQLQEVSDLPFRMVLHRGVVFTGGQMASGTYRLFGPEVNFAFRMEGLAKSLKLDCLLSEPVAATLGRLMDVAPAGAHSVSGVDGSFSFFRL